MKQSIDNNDGANSDDDDDDNDSNDTQHNTKHKAKTVKRIRTCIEKIEILGILLDAYITALMNARVYVVKPLK